MHVVENPTSSGFKNEPLTGIITSCGPASVTKGPVDNKVSLVLVATGAGAGATLGAGVAIGAVAAFQLPDFCDVEATQSTCSTGAHH